MESLEKLCIALIIRMNIPYLKLCKDLQRKITQTEIQISCGNCCQQILWKERSISALYYSYINNMWEYNFDYIREVNQQKIAEQNIIKSYLAKYGHYNILLKKRSYISYYLNN
jgi:hypothetical protein